MCWCSNSLSWRTELSRKHRITRRKDVHTETETPGEGWVWASSTAKPRVEIFLSFCLIVIISMHILSYQGSKLNSNYLHGESEYSYVFQAACRQWKCCFSWLQQEARWCWVRISRPLQLLPSWPRLWVRWTSTVGCRVLSRLEQKYAAWLKGFLCRDWNLKRYNLIWTYLRSVLMDLLMHLALSLRRRGETEGAASTPTMWRWTWRILCKRWRVHVPPRQQQAFLHVGLILTQTQPVYLP